jgi:hypothetical protein
MDLQNCILGIELGSTRIKAGLIDKDHQCVASGSYGWENRLEKGVWVYPLEEAIAGIRACYSALREDVLQGIISKESPLGQAVMGKRIGDRVRVALPGGGEYRVRIDGLTKGRDDDTLPIREF